MSGRIATEDLTHAELLAQLELATGALRFVARYGKEHGSVPPDACARIRSVRSQAVGMLRSYDDPAEARRRAGRKGHR